MEMNSSKKAYFCPVHTMASVASGHRTAGKQRQSAVLPVKPSFTHSAMVFATKVNFEFVFGLTKKKKKITDIF